MSNFGENENILITGASSGIGRATVLELNSEGVFCVGIARREENLKRLKEECPNPDKFIYEARDLSSKLESLENFTSSLTEKYGKFSGFVHCAGQLNNQPLSMFSTEDAIKDFKINVFSAVEIIKALSKKKNKQELLSIVLVSSITAKTGCPGALTYSMTKSALNNLVISLSKEIGNKRIRINSVMPGFCDTELVQKYSESLTYDCIRENIKRTIFKEAITTEQVADLIKFLLSKDSYGIQSQSVIIDGGGINADS